MAVEPWRVKRDFNRRTLTELWLVVCAGEYLRMAGKFSTIRRFRTKAGAQRACDKANAALPPLAGQKERDRQHD